MLYFNLQASANNRIQQIIIIIIIAWRIPERPRVTEVYRRIPIHHRRHIILLLLLFMAIKIFIYFYNIIIVYLFVVVVVVVYMRITRDSNL